jgi:hypothetical protein
MDCVNGIKETIRQAVIDLRKKEMQPETPAERRVRLEEIEAHRSRTYDNWDND